MNKPEDYHTESRLEKYLQSSELTLLDKEDKMRKFTDFYLATRAPLRAYLYSFLPGNDEAIEDCIQETGVVVWAKFVADWDLDAFQKFSYTTARFKALSWLKKNKPAQRVQLSPSIMEKLADKSIEVARDARLDRLQQCMEQLSEEKRAILEARYEEADSKAIGRLAKSLNRSVDGIYKQLERLRTVLKDCVSRKQESTRI